MVTAALLNEMGQTNQQLLTFYYNAAVLITLNVQAAFIRLFAKLHRLMRVGYLV